MNSLPRAALVTRLLILSLALLGGGLPIVPVAAAMGGLTVGTEAPDFTLPDTSGEVHQLSALAGEKLTVLVFWMSGSKKSQQALERARVFLERYRGQGLEVVAVNADGQTVSENSLEEIRAAAKRLGLDFPFLIDQGLKTFHRYGVIALPTMLILNKDRIVLHELSGQPLVATEEMADLVAAAMGAGAPTPAASSEREAGAPKALRFYRMGNKTLSSARTAESAEAWFRKAIEADPRFVQPRLALARLHLERGETGEAKEQLGQVLMEQPANVTALCEQGRLLVEEGRTSEGEALLEKALERALHTSCSIYLGSLRGRQGRIDEALALFAGAKEAEPLDPRVHEAEGSFYEERQMLPEAARAYGRALELFLAEE